MREITSESNGLESLGGGDETSLKPQPTPEPKVVETTMEAVDTEDKGDIAPAAIPSGSQRSDGFKGGIPLGVSATTVSSRGLEVALNQAILSLRVQELAREKELTWVSGLNGTKIAEKLGLNPASTIPMGGLRPDGGIFLDKEGDPVLATEAKKQGSKGNAIERVSKNIVILRAINPGVKNLVFTRGEGFFNGNTAESIMGSLYLSLNVGNIGEDPLGSGDIWNNHRGDNLRIYRFEDSTFEVTAQATMEEAILTALKEV